MADTPFPGDIPPDAVAQFQKELKLIEEHTKYLGSQEQIKAFAKPLQDATYEGFKKALREMQEKEPKPQTIETETPLHGARPNQSTGGGGVLGVGQGSSQKATEKLARRELSLGPHDWDVAFGAGKDWRDRATGGGLGGVLPFPRFPGAKPTVADQLGYLSTIAANVAQKRQTTIESRPPMTEAEIVADYNKKNPKNRIPTDTQGNVTQEGYNQVPEDLMHKMTSGNQYAGSPRNIPGAISNIIGGVQTGYIHGKYITDVLGNITEPMGNMMQAGYALGAQGGSAGPFGMRSPMDPGIRRFLSQKWAQWMLSMHNNVSPHQASTIFQGLQSEGWMGGPQTNAMRVAAANMMQKNPTLASMPQYYQMMDQSTRMGTTSLQAFNRTMQQVPDAMNAAHLSMGQVISDAQQMGQLYQQQGGNYNQGVQAGLAFNQVTGMPSSVFGQLTQNPLVQGQTFMSTGLMPWEQGLASPGQRINDVSAVISRLSNIIQPRSPITQHLPGGFSSTISSQDQKYALMSHFLGMSPQAIKNYVNHQSEITTGANMYDVSTAYGLLAGRHSRSAVNRALGSGPGGGNWGSIEHMLHRSMYLDHRGHVQHMFSPKEISSIANIRNSAVHNWAHKRAEQWVQHHQDHAFKSSAPPMHGELRFNPAYRSELAHYKQHGAQDKAEIQRMTQQFAAHGKAHMPTSLAQSIIRDQTSQIKKDIGNRTGANSSAGTNQNRVTISLSKAAQKMFKLSDPTAQNKASNNAGAVNINTSPYANGPSYPPMSDLNTAGNYNYGGQYNTGPP